ncbi:MAG TPA: VOC family protein [Candidatus Limnocylindrales bacterium]|nr:VOC family protein [Candidatus Limnocylindrales bacterium]
MIRLSTHLEFNGQCAAALRFYERVLGGKIRFMMTYGESPIAAQTPSEWLEKIIHATFVLGDRTLSATDSWREDFRKAQGFAVTLDIDDAEEADRVFAALSESASIGMPIQETFWAQRFGMLVDQFGIPWMINCSKPT